MLQDWTRPGHFAKLFVNIIYSKYPDLYLRAHSVDPDLTAHQTAPREQSDQALHCLKTRYSLTGPNLKVEKSIISIVEVSDFLTYGIIPYFYSCGSNCKAPQCMWIGQIWLVLYNQITIQLLSVLRKYLVIGQFSFLSGFRWSPLA